jgi:cytochrome c553
LVGSDYVLILQGAVRLCTYQHMSLSNGIDNHFERPRHQTTPRQQQGNRSSWLSACRHCHQ